MKKILILFLLALMAFGGSQFLLRQNRQNLKDRTVTWLTLWNMPPKSLPKERKIWEETVKAFEKENPGIRVEGVEREYRAEEFITVMAGGKGPDVVKVWVGAVHTLANLGFLSPLDPHLSTWDQYEYILDVLKKSTKFGGHYYGIPADSYFLFLLYRKDLFQKEGLDPATPPRSWTELASTAEKLTHREKGQYGLGLVPKTWYFQDFVWQAGGEMIREEGGKVRSAFAEPPAVKALQFWKDLRFKHKVLQPDVLMSESELLHLFALGKVAMIFGTEKQLPSLITRYRIDPASFGIAPLPAGPAGSAAHLGGDVYVINSSSSEEERAAAWKWIQFELSPGNQLNKWQRMKEEGIFIYPGAFSASAQVLDLPQFAMVKDALANARVEPHVEGWPRVKDLLDDDPLQNVLLDPSADPQQLLLAHAKQADRTIFATSGGAKP
jgi:multiple sugar transport system substrate-binding protein